MWTLQRFRTVSTTFSPPLHPSLLPPPSSPSTAVIGTWTNLDGDFDSPRTFFWSFTPMRYVQGPRPRTYSPPSPHQTSQHVVMLSLVRIKWDVNLHWVLPFLRTIRLRIMILLQIAIWQCDHRICLTNHPRLRRVLPSSSFSINLRVLPSLECEP